MHPRVISWAEVRKRQTDALIASASDEDLADLKAMVLSRADENTRAALESKRVRESGWLKALIYEALCPEKKR